MADTQLIANYVSGDSFLHKLHPSTKIFWVLGVLFTVFFIKNPFILIFVYLTALLLVLKAKIWKTYFSSIIILFPIIFGLIFFQSVAPAFPKPWTALAHIGPFTLYNEGIYHGLVLSLRILSVASYALLFIITTHTGDLFATLRQWGIPYTLSFMVITTIQLIPILQKEMNVILSAQRSRAMQASGFSALLPSIIPVFAGAIERVKQMSMTLESRAFGSSGKKTSIRKLKLKLVDYILIVLTILIVIVAYYLIFTNNGFDISDTISFPIPFAMTMFFGSIVGFFGIIVYFARNVSS
ncbi:MAG: energy-coupling factor transporter transmembrane component T family protein [Halanaerobiaceae bacterium]